MSGAKRHAAFIFARGGSKGVPRKNVLSVGGIPLIAHAIRCGINSEHIARVIVSTDCDEIATVSREYGAETPFMRPAELAGDASSELLAWRHAIQQTPELLEAPESSLFISIPATSPLRTSADVDRAIVRFNSGDMDILFGISPSQRSPYLNMVTIDDTQHLKVVNAGDDAYRRQDVPEVFDVTTCVYVSTVAYVMSCERLMDGQVGYIEIPPERALDIDTPFDMHIADLLLNNPYQSGDQ